jgi:hypothetical protein
MSVRPSAWNNSAPTGRIFMKFDISLFFENISKKFQFHYSLPTITGTLHADRYTLLISRSVILRVRNVSDILRCTENRNTRGLHCLVDTDGLSPSCLVYNRRQGVWGLHDERAHQQMTLLVFLSLKLSDITQLCTICTPH